MGENYHIHFVDRKTGKTESKDVETDIESAFDLVKSLYGRGFSYQGYDCLIKKGEAIFTRLEFSKIKENFIVTCYVYRQISGFGEIVNWDN